ncbi:hypothetical protein BN1110_04836 [bacterium YEK0313]|nr:hypothetical protein BN1110_04836 [bacterium YEK0313]
MSVLEDRIITWLQDAHAMEVQGETMLSGMVGRLSAYPDLRARIGTHVEDTRRQAKRLRDCLERRGQSTSAVKDAGGWFSAMGQGLAAMMADDEVVKALLAASAFEQMEIASYRILIAAAAIANDGEVRGFCAVSLDEELAMQNWLAENTPVVVAQYFQKQATVPPQFLS